MIIRWVLQLVALVIVALATACDRVDAGAGGSTTASPSQARTIDLAGGRLPALPSGPLYIRVVEFAQDAGGAFKSHQHVPGFVYHVPGFVYVEAGVQRLVIIDGPSIDLGAGEAYFLGSLTHDHLNPGSASNHWYFITLWPTLARGIPLVDPSARVAFATPDFPDSALPPGAYVATLQVMELGPGGRSAAHRHGGVETLFVLDGSIEIRSADAAPVTLGPGRGIHHLPNTVFQEFNAGNEEARYLIFLLTGKDQPFQTNVKQSP